MADLFQYEFPDLRREGRVSAENWDEVDWCLRDAEIAVKLDRARYEGGLADFQATLRAQTMALSDEDQLAQTKAQLSTDLVALYKALGGGWT